MLNLTFFETVGCALQAITERMSLVYIRNVTGTTSGSQYDPCIKLEMGQSRQVGKEKEKEECHGRIRKQQKKLTASIKENETHYRRRTVSEDLEGD